MTCKYFLPFCGQPFDSVYRQWHPTPVLLPGKSHGQRSLMGCCPWSLLQWVARSRTRLSDFTFTFRFHALEKEMATHSRVLAWRVPGTAEPGGLLSLGLLRVGHDWSDLAAAAADVLVCKHDWSDLAAAAAAAANVLVCKIVFTV